MAPKDVKKAPMGAKPMPEKKDDKMKAAGMEKKTAPKPDRKNK